jgi:type I site-specific restriction endonuclease
MSESEKVTRKKRIDTRLKSSQLKWNIIRWTQDLDTSSLDAHAVEEYPTASGPADYALFAKGQLLGIIEAKKLSVGAENVLEQAKRYSKSEDKSMGEWRGYKVPFLYSTQAVTTLSAFQTPEGLKFGIMKCIVKSLSGKILKKTKNLILQYYLKNT